MSHGYERSASCCNEGIHKEARIPVAREARAAEGRAHEIAAGSRHTHAAGGCTQDDWAELLATVQQGRGNWRWTASARPEVDCQCLAMHARTVRRNLIAADSYRHAADKHTSVSHASHIAVGGTQQPQRLDSHLGGSMETKKGSINH